MTGAENGSLRNATEMYFFFYNSKDWGNQNWSVPGNITVGRTKNIPLLFVKSINSSRVTVKAFS